VPDASGCLSNALYRLLIEERSREEGMFLGNTNPLFQHDNNGVNRCKSSEIDKPLNRQLAPKVNKPCFAKKSIWMHFSFPRAEHSIVISC
jgi:hypothetical protein